jgi:hypothetical protein
MGLTVHYEWKTKADLAAARTMIARFRDAALTLPFDDVSEIYEQNPPDGQHRFRAYDGPFSRGTLYLEHKREDGLEDLVEVEPLHSLFFNVYVEGSETAPIGLASHPPVVVHHEDFIELREDGTEWSRTRGAGAPVEFPTRRRGFYSWHSFCKTQYAADPKLGGEANFLRAHLTLIELLVRSAAPA